MKRLELVLDAPARAVTTPKDFAPRPAARSEVVVPLVTAAAFRCGANDTGSHGFGRRFVGASNGGSLGRGQQVHCC